MFFFLGGWSGVSGHNSPCGFHWRLLNEDEDWPCHPDRAWRKRLDSQYLGGSTPWWHCQKYVVWRQLFRQAWLLQLLLEVWLHIEFLEVTLNFSKSHWISWSHLEFLDATLNFLQTNIEFLEVTLHFSKPHGISQSHIAFSNAAMNFPTAHWISWNYIGFPTSHMEISKATLNWAKPDTNLLTWELLTHLT